MAHPEISPEQFDKVASTCGRWHKKSLAVAKAMILEKLRVSEAANRYSMSMQQANIIRTRFYVKADELRLTEFKKRVKPNATTTTALLPFAKDIEALLDDGYTHQQVITYLEEHGVNASVSTVRKFLKSAET